MLGPGLNLDHSITLQKVSGNMLSHILFLAISLILTFTYYSTFVSSLASHSNLKTILEALFDLGWDKLRYIRWRLHILMGVDFSSSEKYIIGFKCYQLGEVLLGGKRINSYL